MARVKDVLDDEEWKVRPLSLLLACCAGILGVMIVVNALGQHKGPALASNGSAAGSGLQQTNLGQGQATQTVVLKYDPLIEDVQRELLAVGIYKGAVDGVNGLRTKQAIQSYQTLNGLPATGEASEELVNQIRFTRKVQQAAQFTGSIGSADVASGTTQAPVARPAPADLPQAAAPQLDPNIKRVQVALAGLGYDIRQLDGQVNEETRAAILKFEMDNGLDMNGRVDAALLSALKVK